MTSGPLQDPRSTIVIPGSDIKMMMRKVMRLPRAVSQIRQARPDTEKRTPRYSGRNIKSGAF
jgi:hypothetical protein